MRKLGILVMALVLVVGMSLGVMAITNPFADNAKVNVTIDVNEMGEMWTSLSNINLNVTRADAYIPDSGKAHDTVSYLSNVPINVSVKLDNDIPDYTLFHIIVSPTSTDYTSVSSDHNQVEANKIITWDKRDGSYNQGSINTSYEAFSAPASTNIQNKMVDYAVEARHAMPEEDTDANTTIVWTISAQ